MSVRRLLVRGCPLRVRTRDADFHRVREETFFLNLFRLFDGGRTRARTLDPLIKSQLLYQLSYAPIELAGPRSVRARHVAKPRKAVQRYPEPTSRSV